MRQNGNLNHLVEPSFHGINRIFILLFENDPQRISSKRNYLPSVEMKNCNVMIYGKDFFDQPINNDKIKYKNIRNIATGQVDDYTTGCLLNYFYFKEN